MNAVGPQEISSILNVTDGIGIHREAVRIPLGAEGDGRVTLDGRVVEIVAPAAGDFDAWIAALGDQIRALDLSGIRRVEE